MDWYNNEDAGDLSAMGAADSSGHLGEMAAEKVAHLVGTPCGWCGQPMTDPVIVSREPTASSADSRSLHISKLRCTRGT